MDLQPISPQLSERVLGLSRDGVTVVVESAQRGICAIAITAKEVAAGDACSGIEEGAPVDVAAIDFNAAGTKAVLRQDYRRNFQGAAWVFELSSGAATSIQLPDGAVAQGSGFVALAWNRQRDEIVGTSYQSAADGSRVQNVVEVDPESATAQVIGEPLEDDRAADGQIVTAGDRMVFSTSVAGEPTPRLISVHLPDGARKDLGSFSGIGDGGSPDGGGGLQNYLLDISADGMKVLVQQLDQYKFEFKGVFEVDLGSGDATRWAGSEKLYVITAAYSPDGQQVMLVARRQDNTKEDRFLLYSMAGVELTDLDPAGGSIGVQSRLQWTQQNLLTVDLPSNSGTDEAVGWQLNR